MRQCKVWIEGLPGSPYSQSAKDNEPFLDRESHEDYDKRTWRSKCTTTSDGQVAIPAMALKQAMIIAAVKSARRHPIGEALLTRRFFASGFFCESRCPIQWTSSELEMRQP